MNEVVARFSIRNENVKKDVFVYVVISNQSPSRGLKMSMFPSGSIEVTCSHSYYFFNKDEIVKEVTCFIDKAFADKKNN
jgi:hypothetical protein